MTDTKGFQGRAVAAFESRLAAEMVRLNERHGGRPFVAASMREVPLDDNREAVAFGNDLLRGRFDLIVFLTGVGARTLVDVLRTRTSPQAVTAALGRATLVVRGPKPAAVLKELGLTAGIAVPEPNTWRDLVRILDEQKPVKGLRVAVQEYGVSNAELLEALTARGAAVTSVPVYRWALPDDVGPLHSLLSAIGAGRIDVMLVTNAVQVDHVMGLLGPDGEQAFRGALSRMVVGSIGPTASERLRQHGLPVDLEPSHPKMGILVKETADRAEVLLRSKRS